MDEALPASTAAEGEAQNETYVVYPGRALEEGQFGHYIHRAALAPLLAHEQQQPDISQPANAYKWMLYGDDDTLWFMEGVLQLLDSFDHNVPYAITDEIFWHNWGQQPPGERFHEDGPPRCLPCHFNTTGRDCCDLHCLKMNAAEA